MSDISHIKQLRKEVRIVWSISKGSLDVKKPKLPQLCLRPFEPILSQVPGFSHLASEYYEVRHTLIMTLLMVSIITLSKVLIMRLIITLIKKVREVDPDDSDNISLDSLHIRVLERCVTKYQPPDRLFLVIILFCFLFVLLAKIKYQMPAT